MASTGPRYDNVKPLSRLKARATALAFGNPLYGLTLGGRAPKHIRMVPPDPWPGKADRGRDLMRGLQEFSGQCVESEQVQWEPYGVTDSWMQEMHSFGWLRDLRTIGGDQARHKARELVADWLDNYSAWHEITWRPDILGRRIASWISLHDFFCASADTAFQIHFYKSLQAQTRHLSRILPARLSGLLLLDALKGLAYAALAFDGGGQKLDQALDLLLDDLPHQILPDGGHVSRNPHDLVLILRHLVDLKTALIAAELEVPDLIESAISHVAPALRFFRHGDGGLALFNGAQEGDNLLIEAILNRSGIRGRLLKSAKKTGFERMSHGRTVILMDTGMPSGDAAHAGTLGFEMSVGKDRLIVNCGSSFDARWRELLRCTAAHSTVTLDDMSSSSFKKDGQIGRRPKIEVERRDVRGACLVQATHDGYVPTHGIVHRRCIYVGEGGDQVMGEDILSGRAGVPFDIRFHLHPSVRAALIRQGEEALLNIPAGKGWRFSVENGGLNLEESIYMGQGVHPRRTEQLSIRGETFGGDSIIKWSLKREG